MLIIKITIIFTNIVQGYHSEEFSPEDPKSIGKKLNLLLLSFQIFDNVSFLKISCS